MVTLAMVTYLDRACIGTMKTTIQAEFGLTEGQFSWVFFSFILAYAMFEIPTARWAEKPRHQERVLAHRRVVERVHAA